MRWFGNEGNPGPKWEGSWEGLICIFYKGRIQIVCDASAIRELGIVTLP
jgi:hypothetical protein